jgi:hypothetical protein
LKKESRNLKICKFPGQAPPLKLQKVTPAFYLRKAGIF